MSNSDEASNGSHSLDSLGRLSVKATERAASLVRRSEAGLRRLRPDRAADDRQTTEGEENPPASPSGQMKHQHVFIVNSDPTFLDAARVILQADQYNVTTTNLVPLTFQMVAAVEVDVMVIDVAIGEPQIWSLIDQLHSDAKTKLLPIVFMSTDSTLLDRAQEQRWQGGGRFVFLKPFEPQDLLDAVQSLIGQA